MRPNDDAARFAKLISNFLGDYAPNMLTASEHTLKSYRDALTLYVAFLESGGVKPSGLGAACFERPRIEEWIVWLKQTRSCAAATCNVRLASIRVFLDYAASRDVALVHLAQDAKTIRRQKTARAKVDCLTRDAVAAMLAAPDLATTAGRRDLVLMVLLYATAARLGELLALKVGQLRLDGPKPHVTVTGKGNKNRTLYLLPRAVSHIRKYLAEAHGDAPDPDARLFYSRVGGKHAQLTQPAVAKRLKKHAAAAHRQCPEVPLGLHAHQFRHGKASHWIEDGLNVLQVSFLLGHAHLETTMVYLDVTLTGKAEALATLESEKERRAPKKWKNQGGSLAAFCGLPSPTRP
jgi:site-specific recombinase XerD